VAMELYKTLIYNIRQVIGKSIVAGPLKEFMQSILKRLLMTTMIRDKPP
jgi:hypothetical protein